MSSEGGRPAASKKKSKKKSSKRREEDGTTKPPQASEGVMTTLQAMDNVAGESDAAREKREKEERRARRKKRKEEEERRRREEERQQQEAETSTAKEASSVPIEAEPKVPDDDGKKERKSSKKSSRNRTKEKRSKDPPAPAPAPPVDTITTIPQMAKVSRNAGVKSPHRSSGAQVVTEENDDGYDDDFEDYDDDFEDDDPSEMVASTSSTSVSAKASRKNVPSLKMSNLGNSGEIKAVRTALERENEAIKNRKFAGKAEAKEGHTSEHRISPGGFKRSKDSKTENGFVADGLPGAEEKKGSVRTSRLSSLDPRAKRVRELRSQIKFETQRFQIYASQPSSPYEVYMKGLRAGVTHQLSCQTNDDNQDVPVQTEPVEYEDKFNQAPDDMAEETREFSGGTLRLKSFLHGALDVLEVLLDENIENHRDREESKLDDTQPKSFSTQSTGIGVEDVEDQDNRRPSPGELANFLGKRPIVDLKFSPSLLHICAVAYGSLGYDPDASTYASMGVITVWDIHSPSSPKFTLISDGAIRCLQLSPGQSRFVAAGTEEGSIVLWDLWEVEMDHVSDETDALGFLSGLRRPTYATDNIHADGHMSSISSISFVMAGSGNLQLTSLDDRGKAIVWIVLAIRDSDIVQASEKDLGLGIAGRFKLAKTAIVESTSGPSLLVPEVAGAWKAEECAKWVNDNVSRGRVGAWALRLVRSVDQQSRSSKAPYINSGSALLELNDKTLKETFQVVDPKRREDFLRLVSKHCGPSATLLHFFPGDTNRFLVGTSDGKVVHCCRFSGGESVDPILFSPEQGGKLRSSRLEESKGDAAPVLHAAPLGGEVTSIAFCKAKGMHNYFLVGRSNGSVCLYSTAEGRPLFSWTADGDVSFSKTGIVSIQWADCRPCVFFVLDSAGCIHVFDLLHIQHNEFVPVHSEKLWSPNKMEDEGKWSEDSDPAVPSFISLSPDPFKGGHQCSMVVGLSDASLQLHTVHPYFSHPRDGEDDALRKFLDAAV